MTAAIVASLVLAAALVGAWLLARKWRAETAAVSLVVLAALLIVPRLFVVDGVFLKEASGLPGSRLVLIAGMDVGAVGVAFLAFLVFGFIAPLVGAILATRRKAKGSQASLRAHLGIVLAALLLSALPFTPVFRDAHFALVRGAREDVVRTVAGGKAAVVETRSRRGVKTVTPPAAFPRLACCGNVVYVLDAERVLFPMARFGRDSWGYLHGPPIEGFRTLKSYGEKWRLVAIDWTADNAVAATGRATR